MLVVRVLLCLAARRQCDGCLLLLHPEYSPLPGGCCPTWATPLLFSSVVGGRGRLQAGALDRAKPGGSCVLLSHAPPPAARRPPPCRPFSGSPISCLGLQGHRRVPVVVQPPLAAQTRQVAFAGNGGSEVGWWWRWGCGGAQPWWWGKPLVCSFAQTAGVPIGMRRGSACCLLDCFPSLYSCFEDTHTASAGP